MKKIILVLGVIVALRSSFGIWKLWRTRSLVRDAEMRLEKARLENQKLTEKLAEIESVEFVEREAREKLGLGKPGETVLILPQTTNPQLPAPNSSSVANWRLWWDLYVRI